MLVKVNPLAVASTSWIRSLTMCAISIMRSTILQNNHVSRSCRHAGADTRLQELSDFPTQTCAVNAVSENILCQSGLTSIFAPALPEYCLMDIRKKCSAVYCCSRLMLLFRFFGAAGSVRAGVIIHDSQVVYLSTEFHDQTPSR